MNPKQITITSNNILYLDFDGTLTGVRGSKVIDTSLCKGLSTASSIEERNTFKKEYDNADKAIKITEKAKEFLNRMNALYPTIQIVIISRNYENYIRAILEFENIDTTHITIYPRGIGAEQGPGEDKYAAVKSHELKSKAGIRLIADDDETDCEEMIRGAKNVNNEIISAHADANHFEWGKYLSQIMRAISHILPVSEYLNGSVTNRFHLFTANTGNFKELNSIYKDTVGDDLKRSILNDLKGKIKQISDMDALKDLKEKFKSSPEYQIIAKGQGLITRIFCLETDSQRAVELIFNKHEGKLNKDNPLIYNSTFSTGN